MIKIENLQDKLEPITLKLDLPQVGTKRIEFLVENDNLILSDYLDGEEIDFIIDNDYNLSLGKGHHKLSKKANSLLMAGTLVISNGKIVEISNDSGHYMPSVDQFLSFVNSISEHPIFELKKIRTLKW